MKRYITILLAVFALVGCLKNDIPYPVVKLEITGVAGEGFTVESIDGPKAEVTLLLDEATDISKVKINSATLTDKAKPSLPLTGLFDLRTPIYVTLSLYQDYPWKIVAKQPIAREFAIAGQIGKSEIDIENRTVKAYIQKGADLKNVTVTALKLGPAEITSYSPTLEQLSGSSFETVRFVDVTCHERAERWLINVLHSDSSIRLREAQAWSQIIWLAGDGIEGSQAMGFRIARKTADGTFTEWEEVTGVKITGGSFETQYLATAQTTYKVKAFCDDLETAEQIVTTGTTPQLTNGGFEQWNTFKNIVYPYTDETETFWGTGNPGASIGGATLTNKGEKRPGSAGEFGAELTSKFVNVAGIGKFAAGNLFTGKYERTLGTDGILTFGRPFTQRPTGVKVWVKYTCGIIDRIGKDVPPGLDFEINNSSDNGIIYLAMGRWTPQVDGKTINGVHYGTEQSPLAICTQAANRKLFDAKAPSVVGYGERVMDKSSDQWEEIIIPIIYPDKGAEPTHILVVCSASRWGDYFTGSTQSQMWIDDMELIYTPIK